MSEFLSMGGYGIYVWSAYGVTLISMVVLLWLSWSGAKSSERDLETLRGRIRPAARAGRKPISARRGDGKLETQKTTS